MIVEMCLLVLAAATPTEALFTGTVPADVPTFEVTMRDQEPFFAGVKIDGEWARDHAIDIPPARTIELVPDHPFYARGPIRTTARSATMRYEATAMRRARLEKIWADYGYIFWETKSGWRPVRQEDLKLAQRARAMEQALFEGESQVGTAPSLGASPGDSGLSPVTIRLAQASIALIGLSLIIVILGRMRRRENGIS